MAIKRFDVIKTQNTAQIQKNEQLGLLATNAVLKSSICEIQLKNGCTHVSLLVPSLVYEKIKNDKSFMVVETGYWTTLADKTVTVKRMGGEIIKPLTLF